MRSTAARDTLPDHAVRPGRLVAGRHRRGAEGRPRIDSRTTLVDAPAERRRSLRFAASAAPAGGISSTCCGGCAERLDTWVGGVGMRRGRRDPDCARWETSSMAGPWKPSSPIGACGFVRLEASGPRLAGVRGHRCRRAAIIGPSDGHVRSARPDRPRLLVHWCRFIPCCSAACSTESRDARRWAERQHEAGDVAGRSRVGGARVVPRYRRPVSGGAAHRRARGHLALRGRLVRDL